MFAFTRISLARQFMLMTLIILVSGMVIIGVWVGMQIETGVLNRTAAVTSLYLESFISPYLQPLSVGKYLEAQQVAELDRLLEETPLGREIVAFKVWSADGHVLYSPNADLIGREFAPSDNLNAAWKGLVTSGYTNLMEPENEYEHQLWERLIETYLPIRVEGSGPIIAVAEFYQTPDKLEAEVRTAQLGSWVVVGTATVAMYLMLIGLVRRASNTILTQQDDLQVKVTQLSDLLAQNRELHTRVRRAAAHSTALNERFLRRLSADLHDGPGQDLSLALLRFESLAETWERCLDPLSAGSVEAADFNIVRSSITSALKVLRTISTGLRLPELEPLSPQEVASRAVRDYERKTGQEVALDAQDAPDDAPMPVKIIMYRVIQEALANGFRHASGAIQSVSLSRVDHHLSIEVADAGMGFDLNAVMDAQLGLAGMRERVQMLGGSFIVDTAPGQGVRVSAKIPLHIAASV